MKNRVVWLTVLLLIVIMGFSPSRAQENILVNGGFEDGVMPPWSTYGPVTSEVVDKLTDAAVSEAPVEGEYCLHLVVPEAGANFWDAGLQHAGHVFETGKKYTLSAFLKSKSGDLQINFKPELGEDPWTGYGSQAFTMTEEWTEFSITTPVFTENVDPATITFHIQYAAGDFWIDGVRFYEGDYVEPSFSSFKARKPDPADGATHEDTWASLSWEPGISALSHDVYFGDNFDDVNEGAPDTFQCNQAAEFYVVGFPGFAFPDGLVTGTTYYWRIDEINENDPNSPWRGDVWSFFVPPRNAYSPEPADGAKFIDPNVELSWNPGFEAKIHNVYFGDNFEDVNAGAGATAKGPVGNTDFTPGTLELDKTYYWRIDAFDGIETHKGDIWSFTITKVGGGVRADYFKGMNFDSLVLTRTDPDIDFNWGDPGGPDPLVGDDNFSVRWSGQVEAAFTETYTFYARTDDGVRLWVEGQLLIDNWVNRSATENKATIDLVAGQFYSVVMEYYEDGGGAVAELRWSSPHTPKQIIPQAAFSLPLKASSPNPRSGSVDVKQTSVLTWGPGDFAASHEVYFGTDEDAIRNADTGSPEYKGSRSLGSESYDPGKLDWDTTYYWRVDEVNNANPDSPWIGGVWSFTTADFLIIDNFESYDAGDNQIWFAWHDGLGYGVPGSDPYFAGNGTGSAVGDENTPSYTEETIVHGGSQAMPFFYDNNKQGFFKYSEAELTIISPRNWTENAVDTLTIWFHGSPDNAAEPVYVALNGNAVVFHENSTAALINAWMEWNIDLQEFANQGVNLSNVNIIALGLGDKNNPQPGGAGVMYFDDIRVGFSESEPVEIVDFLNNGGFEDGVLEPWETYGDVTTEVVQELVNAVLPEAPVEGGSCLHVTVNSLGANSWDAGLQHSGHVFEAGKKYTLSAFLKCSQGTMDINFKPELAADPWTGYGDQVFTMTEEWAEYSVTTPVLTENVDPATITFHIGFAAGDFWVDGVRFYQGDYVAPDSES
jgi:hypothetical protein